MAAKPVATTIPDTMGELLEQLGDISPERVRLRPVPGQATEEDLLDLMARTDRLFELVDGTLVEKTMGFLEGNLATWIGYLLYAYLEGNNIGTVGGADSTMRLMKGLVRLPDIAFVRWDKLPNRQLPTEPIPDLGPDLAVEVLSKKNTQREMDRKRKEYFLSGTELVWLVDPRRRTVRVFVARGPEEGTLFTENDTLDGGAILPGLTLPVRRIFERLPPATSDQLKRSRRKPKPGESAA